MDSGVVKDLASHMHSTCGLRLCLVLMVAPKDENQKQIIQLSALDNNLNFKFQFDLKSKGCMLVIQNLILAKGYLLYFFFQSFI